MESKEKDHQTNLSDILKLQQVFNLDSIEFSRMHITDTYYETYMTIRIGNLMARAVLRELEINTMSYDWLMDTIPRMMAELSSNILGTLEV